MGLAKQATDYLPAEADLLEAHKVYAKLRGDNDKETQDWVQGLTESYTVWGKTAPGKGYDAKAAQWMAKSQVTPKNGTSK